MESIEASPYAFDLGLFERKLKAAAISYKSREKLDDQYDSVKYTFFNTFQANVAKEILEDC